MATSGMTQASQGEPPCDLEMAGGSIQELEVKDDETKPMEDDQDPEVVQSL